MLEERYLDDVGRQFEMYRELAEKSMARLDDDQFFASGSDCNNSVALIVKHMAGNMKSRWTDFLTTDGEKEDRRRDTEFVIEPTDSRDSLMKRWHDGWRLVFEAVATARTLDLGTEIEIRGEQHSLIGAFNRQLTHYAYHGGQIVLLAKQFAGSKWESLSIPVGQSDQFNISMRAKQLNESGDGSQ